MLFDTGIFIYLAKQDANATTLIEQTKNIHISTITYMELLQGAGDSANKVWAVENLLQTFEIQVLELTENISILARFLMKMHARRHALTMGDALVAATAIQSHLELVSPNYRSLRSIGGLELVRFSPAWPGKTSITGGHNGAVTDTSTGKRNHAS